MPVTTLPTLIAEHLWTRARASLARAIAAIGSPAAIAAITCLSPVLRRQIIAWLRPLETVARKLLLAEAAALQRTQQPESAPLLTLIRTSPRRTTGLQPREAPERRAPERSITANAEAWRVRFALALPRDPAAVPDARAPRIRALWGPDIEAPPPQQRALRKCDGAPSSLRLARRFEAVRRVLEDPRPDAERFARLLARASNRFPSIVHRYLFAPARSGDFDTSDPRLAVHAIAQALDAPAAFSDSS